MAAVEVHHQVPRYLLRLYDWAIDDPRYVENFASEAALYGVEAEISRDELEDLIEGSAVELTREEHRGVGGEHSAGGDWARWGRRGGSATYQRYGPGWFAALARRRWGRIGPEMLQEYRASIAGVQEVTG